MMLEMKQEKIKIISDQLFLPKRLSRMLKWKYPFWQIPKLGAYNLDIIQYSKRNKQLPFYVQFDINDDGKEEIILIQKSILGGYGRLLIISEKKGRFKVDKIKWEHPVNSMFFDYLIDESEPKEYRLFGMDGLNGMRSGKILVHTRHIVTKGMLSRIVYWDGSKYCQERIGKF